MKMMPPAHLRTAVAVAHVRTGCSKREVGNIVRLKNSGLRIAEWVSYVEPQHMDKTEPFSPQNAVRRPYDPMIGYDYDYTPRADRFILAGSLAYVEMIFERICSVNLSRFVDMEFLSSLDLIGSRAAKALDEGIKEEYLRNAGNSFCRYLEILQPQMGRGATVHFEDELILMTAGRPKQPTVSLRWHSTYEGMMAFIQEEMQNGTRVSR